MLDASSPFLSATVKSKLSSDFDKYSLNTVDTNRFLASFFFASRHFKHEVQNADS